MSDRQKQQAPVAAARNVDATAESRYKIRADDINSYLEIEAVLADADVPVYTRSRKRFFFSTGPLSETVREALSDLGNITFERQYQPEASEFVLANV